MVRAVIDPADVPATCQESVPVRMQTISVHPLLTAEEVARALNVGERTVWRMASQAKAGAGAFSKPIRIGSQAVRWRWEQVQKYIEESVGK